MLVPNRHGSTDSYRYGFNGMEKDDEVKGESNSYDFGARMLDPRVGRWFAKDPLEGKYPEFSPYIAFGDSPIYYTDPDGNFLLDVHQRITRNSLKGFSIEFNSRKKYKNQASKHNINISLNSEFIYGIKGMDTPISEGVTWPDIHDAVFGDNPSSHFDNMNYLDILNNIQKINDVITNFKNDKSSYTALDLGSEIGQNLHAIQDLYSHSNFVELYAEVYGKTKLSSIPTLEEAIEAGKSPDATDKQKQFAISLEENLKTGKYPSEGNGSHREMNHDIGNGSKFTEKMKETKGKKVSWNTKAAETVATKASKKYLEKVKKAVESK